MMDDQHQRDGARDGNAAVFTHSPQARTQDRLWLCYCSGQMTDHDLEQEILSDPTLGALAMRQSPLPRIEDDSRPGVPLHTWPDRSDEATCDIGDVFPMSMCGRSSL